MLTIPKVELASEGYEPWMQARPIPGHDWARSLVRHSAWDGDAERELDVQIDPFSFRGAVQRPLDLKHVPIPAFSEIGPDTVEYLFEVLRGFPDRGVGVT